MKVFYSLVVILIAGIIYTQAQELDGKTFHISLKLIAGEGSAGSSWTEDEIHFQGDNLVTKFMKEHEHFSPAPCDVRVDSSSVPGEKMISFSAAHKNPGGSNVRWQGAVKGDHIEGSVVWVNANGTRMYSFTGMLK